MFEAKSMYFGGEIISSADCNYQTSRELGLICPFCSSAVFIRSESVREVKGKLQLIRPYFAHYPSGSPDNWDCEKRSHTKQGREELERIKIQARNQRLRLYNAHLWNMLADAHNISHQRLNKIRSLFGERWCEQTSVLLRHELRLSLSDAYTFVDAAIQGIQDNATKAKNEEHHLLQCDIKLHRAICCEVLEFLSTNTSGFVFHKLFKYLMYQGFSVGKLSIGEWKKMPMVAHISTLALAIAATPWTELIRERLENDKQT